MNIYMDCEMTGLHKNTTLISLGMISDDNKTFYAEFTDYDYNQINDWLKTNILSKLVINQECVYSDNKSTAVKGNKNTIRIELIKWLSTFDEHIEIWSDCLSYDWVLFNDIFGTAFDLPKNICYIPFDICTLFKVKGIDPDINREEFSEYDKIETKHNSLHDARVIKKCYEKLIRI